MNRRWLPIALTALVTTVALVLWWPGGPWQWGEGPRPAATQPGDQQPFGARLPGDDDGPPPPAAVSDGRQTPDDEPRRLRGDGRQQGAGRSLLLAAARLCAAGRPAQAMLDRAVTTLEREAAERAPAARVELAVALYGRALCLERPADLVSAFGHLRQALDRHPEHAAARFDLALVLEELQLHRAAAGAWEEYLELDASSDFARQARRRHARLRAAGSTDERPADPCEEPPEDPPDDALQRPQGPGWWQLTAAREQARAGDWEAALSAFQAAEGALRAAGSPLAGCAAYQRALKPYLESAYGDAYGILATALAEPRVEGDGPVRARLLRFQGLIHQILGDAASALDRYLAALAEAGPEAAEALHSDLASSIAWALEDLGQHDAAWQHRQRALQLAGEGSHRVFEEAAETLRAQDHPHLALLYQDELVRRRRDSGPELRVGSLWGRAEILHALARRARRDGRDGEAAGRWARAQDDLAAATAAAHQVEEPASRAQNEADILRIRAAMAMDEDPAGALTYLDEVIASMEATSYLYRLPQGHLSRARALRLLDRQAEAEASLTAAVAEVERQRRLVGDREMRAAFFDLHQSASAELVRLRADGGRYREAFAATEAARTRVLLEWLADGDRDARPLTAGEVQAALPDGLAVVSYQVEAERTLAWVITARGFSGQPLSVGREELRQRIEQLRRLVVAERDAELPAASEALTRRLLEPLRPRLAGVRSLAVIPHGPLHRLPFALLYRPASDRYLIQELPLLTAPSASLLVQALANEARRAKPEEPTLLAVADPAFDGALYPPLVRLGQAAAEVEAIRSLYAPASRTLRGEAATAAALRAAAPTADVLHLATHGLVDRQQAERSALLLAPDQEGDSGILTAEALFSLQLPRARLVVLSACSGGEGPLSGSEGPLSLARPFLAHGVPAVVASLWGVDDTVTARMMPRFHRHWLESGNAAQALRAAQLELLAEPGLAARHWAAFQLYGGAAPGPAPPRRRPPARAARPLRR